MGHAVAISVILFFLLLYIGTFGLTVYVNHNKDVDMKIILLGVIKININDKNRIRTQKKIDRKIDISPGDAIKLLKKLKPYIRYLISKLNIYLNLDLTFGLFSPDKTAITYGIINSLVYALDNLLKSIAKKIVSTYNITPDFDRAIFDTSIELKIKAKLIYILIFAFKASIILFKNRKYFIHKGGALNGSSNRRLNENYNG